MKDPAKAPIVDVLVPARNDERTVGDVVRAVPPRVARTVVVVDNASKDRTAQRAEQAGALVLRETQRIGMGAACLRGIEHLSSLPQPPDVVVLLPADGSADPAHTADLLLPLRENLYDLVIGVRSESGPRGPLTQQAGRFVAVQLIRAVYGHRYTDLGAFRAIRYPALVALGMRDPGSGWWVEMQVRALKIGLRVAEVPVPYRDGPERQRPFTSRLKNGLSTGTRTLFQIIVNSTAR